MPAGVYSGSGRCVRLFVIRPPHAEISKVVLLGPVHRIADPGLALPGRGRSPRRWAPLPDVPACRQLESHWSQVSVNAAAHALEHSLEVQLPFLQRCWIV